MPSDRTRLAFESQALYDRLYQRSLAIPVHHPLFVRLARLLAAVARRCVRRNSEARDVS